MKAIYAGSFSPPTLGHLDIIRRASVLFDEVVVAVLGSEAKQYIFSPRERVEMLRAVTAELPNVRTVSDGGMLVDLVARERADVILRGLRNPEDLTYEMQMAQANRDIGGAETLFMACRAEYSLISSTIVRECAAHGAPITSMVPEQIVDRIYRVFGFDRETGREC